MHPKYVTPDAIGIDAVRLKAASRVIQRGLDAGLYPGAVYIIGRSNGTLEPQCFGVINPETQQPVRPNTIFDLASLTKPIATASSLILLVERGNLHLKQPLKDFFPDYELPHLSEITLFHLLTHTSGLPAYKDLYSSKLTRDEIISAILELSPENPPGSKYTYSCLGYILLGEIIRLVSGSDLDQFSRKNIFERLEMNDTFFNPVGEPLTRTAATTGCPVRKNTLVGQVHDPNAWALSGISGNAGLFSTAIDLSRFMTMLLCRDIDVFSRASFDIIYRNLINPAIGGHTAGWFIHPNEMLPSGDLMSDDTIGHTGFTGTSVVIDSKCDLFVILLTNRVWNPDDGTEFRKTRRLFHNTTAQAVLSI
ncbi:MAG TPA: serine hydrolase domain-containing protein [Armatimonadota bacterium]|nr:serine hydrolase domain-containing protein [Armatimonadota bacterium]HOM70958.1 serine hydrolase domain-containing protein [Armatimonadota bacterium]HPP73746.1 serine hydrolase domain-containing protein [Armatimonadota bacterium]